MLEYIDKHLSPNLCGYRKGVRAGNHNKSPVIVSKVSCLWIQQTGFSYIICSYLSYQKQRIKINNTFSSWNDVILGVPQGSVLVGPLLFNICLNDLLSFLKDVGICNIADDTATYISDKSLENILKSFETNSMLALSWFENNYIKLNTDNFGIVSDNFC